MPRGRESTLPSVSILSLSLYLFLFTSQREEMGLTLLGQPWIEKGQSPLENQVSSTSSSCSNSNVLPGNLISAFACASSRVRPETQNSPLNRYGSRTINFSILEREKETHILLDTDDSDKVSRSTMSPPDLSRDTPVLRIVQPSEPFCSRVVRSNLEFSRLGTLISIHDEYQYVSRIERGENEL